MDQITNDEDKIPECIGGTCSYKDESRIPRCIGKAYTLDGALLETNFGLFNCILIIISGLTLSTSLIESVGISYVLPVAQCDIKITTEEQEIINLIGFVGIIFSLYLWGGLADTLGRRNVMASTLFIGFLFSVLSSFSINFWMMIITRFLTCFFTSIGSAVTFAYVSEFHTDNLRSKSILATSTLFVFSILCLPTFQWLILSENWNYPIDFIGIDFKPWRLLIIAYSTIDLISAIGILFLPESPKFLFCYGKTLEGLNVLKTMYRINTRRPKNEYPVKMIIREDEINIAEIESFGIDSNRIIIVLKRIWDQTAPLSSKNYIIVTVLSSIIMLIIFSSIQGLYVWFPNIIDSINEYSMQNPENKSTICEVLVNKANLSLSIHHINETSCQQDFQTENYVNFIILGILYIVGFVVTGSLIDMVGRRFLLCGLLLIFGVCGIWVQFLYINFSFSTFLTYFYMIQLSVGLAVPVLFTIIVDLYPTNLRVMAIVFPLMFGILGIFLGSNLFELLVNIKCEMMFNTFGVLLIIASFFGFIIPDETKPFIVTKL